MTDPGVPDQMADAPRVDLGGGVTGCRLDRSRGGRGRQGVYYVCEHGHPCVLKVFDRKESELRRLWADLGNCFVGRTGASPSQRYLTERACLAVWRRHGFDVFQECDAAPEVSIGAHHICMEYVPGRSVGDFLADPDVPRRRKTALVARLAHEWRWRHDIALAHREPLLIHEHPTLVHVWMGPHGRLIHYDFEIAYARAGKLDDLIARELIGFLRSLYKLSSQEEFDRYLAAFLSVYPCRRRIERAYTLFFRSPNPVVRAFRFFERLIPRSRRPHSKFRVARMLAARIADDRAGNGKLVRAHA